MDTKEADRMSRIGDVLDEIYAVVDDRRKNPQEGSYTNYLFDKGLDKICKKVGEEATEVVIAAKNGKHDEVVYEVSDLLYHVCVLLVQQGVTLDDLHEELKRRR
jgi:phosphoribosyl-ATP pyrophosphohydrolase/phosphoribosyl-AMP cyclohydrolase